MRYIYDTPFLGNPVSKIHSQSPHFPCWSYHFVSKSTHGANLPSCHWSNAMKLFLLFSLFSLVAVAFPSPRSIHNEDDHPESLEPSSYTSAWIPPTENHPTVPYMESYLKRMLAEHTPDTYFYERIDYEKLVALCEAGFVSGCRAAIERPEW